MIKSIKKQWLSEWVGVYAGEWVCVADFVVKVHIILQWAFSILLGLFVFPIWKLVMGGCMRVWEVLVVFLFYKQSQSHNTQLANINNTQQKTENKKFVLHDNNVIDVHSFYMFCCWCCYKQQTTRTSTRVRVSNKYMFQITNTCYLTYNNNATNFKIKRGIKNKTKNIFIIKKKNFFQCNQTT